MNAGVVLSFHGSLEDMIKKNKEDLDRVSEFRLFRKLSKNFDRVYLFSHDSNDHSNILPDNFEHVRLRNRFFYILFGWMVVLYNALRHDIRLIYAECGPALPPLFLVNKLSKAKTVLNYDNTWFLSADGFKRSLLRIIEEFMLNFVDYFVIASSEIGEFVGKKSGILPLKKGIIVDEFDPKKVKAYPIFKKIKGRVIIFTGRLHPHKDPLTLLRAYSIAKKRIPYLNLIIAGDGELRKECEKSSDRDVHILGFVKDIPGLLKGSDLFVLSSSYDASPRSLMEAMSMGLPCVATRVGGVPDYIDESCGALVEPRNPEALAGKIEELLKSPKKAAKLGKNARERILKYHDLDKNLDRLIGIIKKEAGEK